MDPKNVDRAGKGILAVASMALAAAAKKYGPQVAKYIWKKIRSKI